MCLQLQAVKNSDSIRIWSSTHESNTL
jgi:hypothetical protein